VDVSVIIPNYNGESYILECISRIYPQIDRKENIVVVDNHSSDNSVALLETHYPDITLIKNEKNFGFAYAVNQGIRSVTTDFVILLNNDAFARPNFVRKLYECINQNENIFSVSSKMLSYSNPHLIDDAGDQFNLLGWAFKMGEGEDSGKYQKHKVIFSSCAGAAIYRRKIFEKIGYFDEKFFAYLEDVDICFRANIHGYKNFYCPEAEVLHIGSATSGRTKYSHFKVKISARNSIYLLYKNMPTILLILNAPCFIIGFFIKALFFLMIGFGKSYLSGLLEGLKTIRSIQRTKASIGYFWNYVRVEWMMVKSTFFYLISKFLKFFMKRYNRSRVREYNL